MPETALLTTLRAALLCAAWDLPSSVYAQAQTPAVPEGTRTFLTAFGNIIAPSIHQDERCFAFHSPDARNWANIRGEHQPVYQPPGWSLYTNVLRDPSIVQANGYYWMAYTAGTYGMQPWFGLARSRDLLNWEFVGQVNTTLPDLAPGESVTLSWGPFFFKEADGTIRLFVSLQTSSGGAVVRPVASYEMHPLNSDFSAWSTPRHIPLPLGKPATTGARTNELWMWQEGPTYHAIYVDFSDNAAYCHATSDNPFTGWSNRVRMGFDSMEGGFIFKNPEGGYTFYVENPQGYFRFQLQENFNPYWFNPSTGFVLFSEQVSSLSKARNGKPIFLEGTTTYAWWKGQSKLPLHLSEPLDDADGDGVVNGVEFAIASNPLVPEAGPLQTWHGADGKLRCRYSVLPAAKAITSLMYATELKQETWLPGSEVMKLLSKTMMSDGTLLYEWVQIEPTTPSSLFLRLETTIP